jgi:hypothetical protein
MKCIPVLILAAIVAIAFDNRPAKAQESIDDLALASTSYQPRWTVTADGILLSRSHAKGATLVEDGTTDAELVNVADFDLGWAAGPQFELTRHFDSGWDIAVRYFGIDGWSAVRELADPNNLRVPLVSTSPTDFFDTANARYKSQLYNAEVNVKRAWGERARLLAGFRTVQLNEQIAAGAYSPTLEGTFDFSTANYLYGFQVGAESALWNLGPVQFDGFLKAGAFSNSIRSNMRAEGTHLSPMDVGSTASRVSFLGELGLTAKYRFGDHCSIHGGYELMWLEGVALAGNSVAAMNQLSDFTLYNGSAFYHGAVAGIEFCW